MGDVIDFVADAGTVAPCKQSLDLIIVVTPRHAMLVISFGFAILRRVLSDGSSASPSAAIIR